MGTVVSKTQHALLSKEDARKAINEKGVECVKDEPFKNYGDKIRLIGTQCGHRFKTGWLNRFGDLDILILINATKKYMNKKQKADITFNNVNNFLTLDFIKPDAITKEVYFNVY